MGRKVEVDIDSLFEILGTLEDGGYSIPTLVFDIIGDCNLGDIDSYAKTVAAAEVDQDACKRDLEAMLKPWLGAKAIADMRAIRVKNVEESKEG